MIMEQLTLYFKRVTVPYLYLQKDIVCTFYTFRYIYKYDINSIFKLYNFLIPWQIIIQI